MHCDSKVVIDLINQETMKWKMNRHILVRYKTVRNINKNVISLNFVRSEKNLADHLIKGLSRSNVLISSRGMDLKPVHSSSIVGSQPLWLVGPDKWFKG